MNRLLLILLVAFATVDVYGQVGLGTLMPFARGTSAVDVNGVGHEGKDYPPRRHPPWMDDIIEAYSPHYPYADRAA
jgi:hypothetical protein